MGDRDETRLSVPSVRIGLAIGCAAALGAVAFGPLAPLIAGAAAAAAFAYGIRRGHEEAKPATRAKLFRVADELVQYRAFTHLLRDQGVRITDMTEDAALAIASGLQEVDARIAALADRIKSGTDPAELHAEADAITQPIVEMLGKLQFQDITRQQLIFLSRLSILLDEHMADLARRLGDRRSLDRTSRFKEMFDQALDDTVMTSQRNDHHSAVGTELFESTGPKVELFQEETPP
jgi:hypothetical protein